MKRKSPRLPDGDEHGSVADKCLRVTQFGGWYIAADRQVLGSDGIWRQADHEIEHFFMDWRVAERLLHDLYDAQRGRQWDQVKLTPLERFLRQWDTPLFPAR